MSRRDDDLIGIDTEGSVYRDPLVDFLDDLRALGSRPAPAPSPALATMLRGATPLRVVAHPVRRVIAALLVAALVAVIAAAETHDLPAPAEHVVSNMIDHLSPFHLDGIAHGTSGMADPVRRPVTPQPGVVRRLAERSTTPGRGAHPATRPAPELSAMQFVPTQAHPARAARAAHPQRGAHRQRALATRWTWRAHLRRHHARHHQRSHARGHHPPRHWHPHHVRHRG